MTATHPFSGVLSVLSPRYKLCVASYYLKKFPARDLRCTGIWLDVSACLGPPCIGSGCLAWGPSMEDRCSILSASFLSVSGNRAEWCSLCPTRCHYCASSPRTEGCIQYYTRPRDAAASDPGEQVSPSLHSSGRHTQFNIVVIKVPKYQGCSLLVIT